MEGANENTRAAQEPHRPETRQRRYRNRPEPRPPSRPAKPDWLADNDDADLRRRMPQLALAPASLRRPGFPWTGRCTARVSVSELRAQCRRTNRTSLKRSVTRSKRFFFILHGFPHGCTERSGRARFRASLWHFGEGALLDLLIYVSLKWCGHINQLIKEYIMLILKVFYWNMRRSSVSKMRIIIKKTLSKNSIKSVGYIKPPSEWNIQVVTKHENFLGLHRIMILMNRKPL